MAAAVVSSPSPIAYCGRIEQFGQAELLRMGLDGTGLTPTTAESTLGLTAGSIAGQMLQLATKGYVEFVLTMAADTNTAGVLNLTDTLGVDFLTASTSRRVEVDALIKADVDASWVKERFLVACAATPVVYRFLQGFTADAAAAANASATVGAGDITTAINGSAAVLSQSSNDVILTLTGITNIDTTWVVYVRVYPAVAHALVATT
jgi:hypothetical protein